MSRFIHIREKGQSLVEVALFLPLFLIIVGGLVEVGQFLVVKNRIDTAANIAARFGANGGQNEGMAEVAINSITQTLPVDSGSWDIWAFRGTVNSLGTEVDISTFEYEHVYGDGATNLYPEFVDNNANLRTQIYNELVRTDEEGGTDQQNIKDLQFAGTIVVYDAESILRLNTVLQDVYSVQALHVMRTFPSSDATNGCSAFPIVIQRGMRSLSKNEYNSLNFVYPTGGIPYTKFPSNVENVALEEAKPGYLYLLKQGSGEGNFGWIRWNEYSTANENNLEASLTWPGRSTDYSNSGAQGQSPPGYSHSVYGYIEPGDATDKALHIGDWLAGTTGSINSSGIRTVLQDHINRGRTMRYIVYDTETATGQGANAKYQVYGFVVLRLHGYRVQGGTNSWILAEFVSWDNSCGQTNNLPTNN